MPEYIEREALRAEALRLTGQSEFAFDHCFPYWQFSKCIKEAPSVDVVPVVRCKDCIHDGMIECPLCYIENHTMRFINHDGNWYCGDGEKKEDET